MKKNTIGVILLGMVLCLPAHTGLAAEENSWTIKNLEDQRLQGLEGQYRKTQFVKSQAIFVAHTVWVDKRSDYQSRLVNQPNNDINHHPSIVDIAKANNALLAVNGGYFLPNFKPAGLYIFKGETRVALSSQASLSGILSIDKDGKIHILNRGDDLSQSYYAVQAGPYLIDPGGKMGIHSPGKIHRRTVVGLTSNRNLFFINTSPVTLYDLAYLLYKHPKAFGLRGVDRALNLDGGPSSALYVNIPSSEIVIKEKLAVRNYIILTQ